MSFSGRRILVTGASTGIGAVIAQLLVAEGAFVVACGTNGQRLTELVEALGGVKHCLALQGDLSDPEQVLAISRAAGDVDGLVNNAGIALNQPFLEATLESWNKTFAVNATAPFLLSQHIARNMIQRGTKGSIVNVSSQASQVGLCDHTSYCASKGALDQLTRCMALELGCHGIRVNCVLPTVVLTEMGSRAWSSPEKAKPMLDAIPLHRFASSEDVAEVVLFLLSEKSSMVNGTMVPIDGGFLATRGNIPQKKQ